MSILNIDITHNFFFNLTNAQMESFLDELDEYIDTLARIQEKTLPPIA